MFKEQKQIDDLKYRSINKKQKGAYTKPYSK